MQQYFSDRILNEGDVLALDEEILHHLIKVLRKDTTYIFRICDREHRIFTAHLIDDRNCQILKDTSENNELETQITCILSLIKNDPFEYCIQKLTELGVTRIVPYQAERSVIRIRDEKKMKRLRKIAQEAAEQSHRNIVPEICEPARLKDLKNYLSDQNYLCYEAETKIEKIDISGSVTFIIGPEGGFTEKEFEQIREMGYESVSLGKRILRAETAALYMTSVIVSKCQ